MKFTCLSEGGGFHFPPCHLLNVCGFRVLIDCPMDLSALSIFSPIPIDSCTLVDEEASTYSSHRSLDSMSVDQKGQKIENPLDASNLISSEPWYKTIKNLHLWNLSFVDIVLISSQMGMLGLPYLTRAKGFSAKIYATEATARLGQLMMEDLVAMHMEFRQFYGPEESGCPQWMKWEALEVLPLPLKEIALGEDGSEIGSWMPLYSAADVKDCMQKVKTLKYGEEVCYNGTLVIQAFSSGLEIGSEVVIYSDFSTWNLTDDVENENSCSGPAVRDFATISDADENREMNAESLLNTGENSEEMEKIAFICSCSIDSVKAGGSVLIPIGRLGILLQLLEQISISLESANLKVPIFIISSIAEELMGFFNIIPEWLCKHRQEKLYSGLPLFAHVELIKEKRLHLFPAIHSLELLKIWQEPCVVFCPHWSLRLGPAVHLLQRWCNNQNSLLVIEEGLDADLALLPFKPVAMKVLQCSFLSGIKLQKLQPLLKILQPKVVLEPSLQKLPLGGGPTRELSFSTVKDDVSPEISRRHISSLNNKLPLAHFTENETLRIPSLNNCSELEIAAELASQLSWIKLKKGDTKFARLKGELLIESGRQRLVPQSEQLDPSKPRPLLYWGTLNSGSLLTALQKMGVNVSIGRGDGDSGSGNNWFLRISEPNVALIEVNERNTVISTDDENLASLICEAISSTLNGI
ncbi:hypothetical protein LguiA_010769 [Lonicera macranthoides]